MQIGFPSEITDGIRTNAVKGELSPIEAAGRLLAGTNLKLVADDKTGVYSVTRISPSEKNVNRAAQPTASDRPMQNRNSSADDTPPVELSPFNVDASRDAGYQADSTLAGSRLNTKLRDTPASVSVFTKELIADLGIADLHELLDYTVNSEVNTMLHTGGENQNFILNAQGLTGTTIRTRGLDASQGLDYFRSITPADPYRIGRFDDSRGPNSILFGIGPAGGMFNQSSKVATLYKDEGAVRFGVGSWDRRRLELDANKVLRRRQLSASLAALHQENGGWRRYDFDDRDRIFGAVTFRPISQLTLRAMGETGRQTGAVIRTYADTEQMLAWYDNRQALGANALTFTPSGANPTPAQMALGVTGRNAARGGLNRRFVYIENNATLFDAIGTYLSGSYNNAAVRAPDGTPGVTSTIMRINDPAFYPYRLNAAGPGMYRDQTLSNYTLTADWQLTDNLFLNLGHNFQKTKATVFLLSGALPTLRGDANRTLGVGGPANPFAGQLYFDGDWQRDIHFADSKESRLSLSYTVETKSKWLGRHRIMGLVARTDENDERAVSRLVLAGRPFSNAASNLNNRVIVRNYLSEGDHGTYRVGDWRSLPSTLSIGGQTYSTVWAHEVAGAGNSGAMQKVDSGLAVVQSHFFNARLVTTLGYREDRAEIVELGYYNDPILGDVVDHDPAKSVRNMFTGRTRSVGGVFHVSDWLSLIANRSSSVGVPTFNRKLFPEGNLPDPTKGEGSDYGLGFEFLDGRLSAKVVYFTSSDKGAVGAALADSFRTRNARVMDAFAAALVGSGLPFSTTQWQPTYSKYTPPVTGTLSDFDSDGYEARIVVNLKSNWRLIANYSYTDATRTNAFSRAIPWYGLKAADGPRLSQGVSQNAAGQYVIDASAYQAGGTVAKWIELGALNPAANLPTLTTSSGQTVAQELFELVNDLNAEKANLEKRWGLRPHKISVFTAYDFKEGRLKGFTLGGGWRWRSPNVLGTTSRGDEIRGRAIPGTDLLIRHVRRFKGLRGSVAFQLNINNLFDQDDIIPSRLSTAAAAPDGYVVPNGRGLAYSRYEIVAPREFRFTTTYSF